MQAPLQLRRQLQPARARIPDGITVVSESGIKRAEQLVRLGDAQVCAVLVGEQLMRAEDPEAALRELLFSCE